MALRRRARPNLIRSLGVLALCALVLAVAPLQAHRPDCHLKPRPDCGACLTGSTTANVEAPPVVERDPLPFLGTLETHSEHGGHAGSPLHLPSRAPPA